MASLRLATRIIAGRWCPALGAAVRESPTRQPVLDWWPISGYNGGDQQRGGCWVPEEQKTGTKLGQVPLAVRRALFPLPLLAVASVACDGEEVPVRVSPTV